MYLKVRGALMYWIFIENTEKRLLSRFQEPYYWSLNCTCAWHPGVQSVDGTRRKGHYNAFLTLYLSEKSLPQEEIIFYCKDTKSSCCDELDFGRAENSIYHNPSSLEPCYVKGESWGSQSGIKEEHFEGLVNKYSQNDLAFRLFNRLVKLIICCPEIFRWLLTCV